MDIPKELEAYSAEAIYRDFYRKLQLSPKHPDHPYGFAFDQENDGWEIYWGGYTYWLDRQRTVEPLDALATIESIAQKWSSPGTTSEKVGALIRDIRNRNGWMKPFEGAVVVDTDVAMPRWDWVKDAIARA